MTHSFLQSITATTEAIVIQCLCCFNVWPSHNLAFNSSVFGSHGRKQNRFQEKKNFRHESCLAILFPNCIGSHLHRDCQEGASWKNFQICNLERNQRVFGRCKHVHVWTPFSISRGSHCGQCKEECSLHQLLVSVGRCFWQRRSIHFHICCRLIEIHLQL